MDCSRNYCGGVWRKRTDLQHKLGGRLGVNVSKRNTTEHAIAHDGVWAVKVKEVVAKGQLFNSCTRLDRPTASVRVLVCQEEGSTPLFEQPSAATLVNSSYRSLYCSPPCSQRPGLLPPAHPLLIALYVAISLG